MLKNNKTIKLSNGNFLIEYVATGIKTYYNKKYQNHRLDGTAIEFPNGDKQFGLMVYSIIL